jgi:hypothetical protein
MCYNGGHKYFYSYITPFNYFSTKLSKYYYLFIHFMHFVLFVALTKVPIKKKCRICTALRPDLFIITDTSHDIHVGVFSYNITN